MSSLTVGRLGLDLEGLELWLAGLFSAAELAAADLLLQLSVSVAKGGDDDDSEEAAPLSSSATTQSPSPRSATPGCDRGDLTVEEEEVKEELDERRVVEKPAVSAELDRRARKRYRRLSDLYAATTPLTSDSSDAAKTKKRKRSPHRHEAFGSSSPSGSSVEPTRHGGDY